MVLRMVMMTQHDECVNESRIVQLENEREVNRQRLNHYKRAVADLQDDLEEVTDRTYKTELLLTKSVDDMRLEIVEIHTTIRNISYLISLVGGLVAILVAFPEVLHILRFGFG